MKEYIGIDIGGTKCAIVRGDEEGRILDKTAFPTEERDLTIKKILDGAEQLWTGQTVSMGISCGGPLDSREGVILGPPNLPGWDHVPIVSMLEERFHVPAKLMNDANACAVAEWKFGAGKGCQTMVFLTFGTGLGAGLIIDGRLYEGPSGMAGEVGHVRLFDHGHIGYHKPGSYEGYCSGGGIAQYGMGSAAQLGKLAGAGEKRALEIWRKTGENLGRLLAILVDILNPECIVIGSIYTRARQFMEADMRQVLEAEALKESLRICRVVPAELGESLGDMAALSVAMTENEREESGGADGRSNCIHEKHCQKFSRREGVGQCEF